MDPNSILLYNQKQQARYAALTGISVDIQNIGKNTETIALRENKSIREIYKGVWLSKFIMEFPDGNFTNVYNLFWNPRNSHLASVVHSEQKPYYLLDYMKSDPSILAVMNGSYFFLIDVVDKEPKEYPFNFCIRDNQVVGLPSSDEPIIFTKEKKLFSKEPAARGTIKIAGEIITWTGSRREEPIHRKNSAKLYNSACAKLIKTYDPNTGVRMGTLDNTCIHTPVNKNVVDIIVNTNEKGKLRITEIKPGGGTHFFDGLFILQVDKHINKFSIEDMVTPLTLDDLDLQTISSGITVGKSVKHPYFWEEERLESRDARSVIAQDVAGYMHYIVFDGSKYIPRFKGVSSKDILPYFSEHTYEWANYLDGGSSSRIIFKDGNKYNLLANRFAFKKITNDTFLWDWKRHRKLGSSIALKINKTHSD